ncbi:hypothetical protein LCGC14_1930860 [marine sediment metagenome]|uniref:Uncharacterized protein n=1 Tax=marine sediment metagenome TaxID=412755 RepID=A0A0F9IKT8_9ZZZZ
MTAKQISPIPDPEPLATLSEDTLKHMDNMLAELDKAKKSLEDLEGLGIDSSLLKEKIEWGYRAREVVLKTFGKKE